MTVEMTIGESDFERNPKTKHIREIDALKAQCDICKLWKPKTPTKDCAVREKLVQKDSEIGWKNKHLFLNTNGRCKMFQEK
mgnify:CR=1 FL=1